MNTNTSFQQIQTTLQHTIEQYERAPKSQPRWLTPKHKRLIRKQHRLFKARKANPTPLACKRHAACRNKVRKTIREAKKETLATQIQEAGADSKQLTKVLRSVLPQKPNTRTSPTTLIYNNVTYTEPTDIANALNDHYITIGARTANSIPNSNANSHPNPEPSTPHPLFRLRHITTEETERVLKQLNPNKASDIFKIKPIILKDNAIFFAPLLTRLYNQAIEDGEYPDALKITKVIEIYKAKDKTLPVNYRPISLLPIIAKVLDKLINNQLMDHLLEHDILSPTQYAFRPHSSTSMALQTILNNIITHVKQRHPTLAIYVDLSKAYDTISHTKLIDKLTNEFNFDAHTANFFASYFRNRLQSTHTQNATSTMQLITHGIPQGSTLSTTLFILYINNIIHTVPNSKVYTYADDTTLIITAHSIEDLQKLAQSDLSSLITYFYDNNLVPNATKTNYTIFHPRAIPPSFALHVGNTTLEHKPNAKLLGIYIDNAISHTHTIAHIIKKLQPHIQSFKYATKLLPRHNMIQLYYSLIVPHFIYAITVWGTDDKKKQYIQPLIKLQKKIIRIVMNCPPQTHTKPLLTEYKLLSIPYLYIQRVCTEMHPYIHPIKTASRPEHQHNYTKAKSAHTHATRQATAHKLAQLSATAPLSQRYITLWNALPESIRETTAPDIFKKELKLHLLEHQTNHY